MTVDGNSVSLAISDGTTMAAYIARPVGPTLPVAVVVIHELFGVNPDIRGVADRLAREGHLTIAPEFYHRHAERGRWLPRNDVGRDEGFALLHKLDRAEAVRDVADAVAYLKAVEEVTEVAVIGFSAGGHLAYLAACLLPIPRTVVLYGGWLTSTEIPLSQPKPTLTLTDNLTGQLLYLVGQDDPLIPAEDRRLIGRALDAAGVEHEVVSYPGAVHAFFWEGTPSFHEASTSDAWRRILALLAA